MPKLTDILPQIKDKTRVNLYLDGKFFCGMDFVTVVEARLKVGMEIDGDRLSALQLQAEEDKALQKGMHHLSASMKTEKEVADFLQKKGYTPAVCAAVVERLIGYGFLNDEEYAKEYVESYEGKKGNKLMRMELRQKGVSDRDIDRALNGKDETEGAKEVLKKYLRGRAEDRETYQKAYRHLLSKGFSYETAQTALRGLKGEDDEY